MSRWLAVTAWLALEIIWFILYIVAAQHSPGGDWVEIIRHRVWVG